MNNEPTRKITLTLPNNLYHTLRNQAHKQGLSLPDFIQKKIQLRPSPPSTLSTLPLKELIAQTSPPSTHPDERLDFFAS